MGKELTLGTCLDGRPHAITAEKMIAFERVIWHRVANVHSDPQEAKRVGMSRMIASGQNQLAFLHQLLHAHFQEGWNHGGRIRVRWTCPAYVGDVITPKATVTKIAMDGGRTLVELDICCTNQAEATTAVGTARVYLT